MGSFMQHALCSKYSATTMQHQYFEELPDDFLEATDDTHLEFEPADRGRLGKTRDQDFSAREIPTSVSQEVFVDEEAAVATMQLECLEELEASFSEPREDPVKHIIPEEPTVGEFLKRQMKKTYDHKIPRKITGRRGTARGRNIPIREIATADPQEEFIDEEAAAATMHLESLEDLEEGFSEIGDDPLEEFIHEEPTTSEIMQFEYMEEVTESFLDTEEDIGEAITPQKHNMCVMPQQSINIYGRRLPSNSNQLNNRKNVSQVKIKLMNVYKSGRLLTVNVVRQQGQPVIQAVNKLRNVNTLSEREKSNERLFCPVRIVKPVVLEPIPLQRYRINSPRPPSRPIIKKTVYKYTTTNLEDPKRTYLWPYPLLRNKNTSVKGRSVRTGLDNKDKPSGSSAEVHSPMRESTSDDSDWSAKWEDTVAKRAAAKKAARIARMEENVLLKEQRAKDRQSEISKRKREERKMFKPDYSLPLNKTTTRRQHKLNAIEILTKAKGRPRGPHKNPGEVENPEANQNSEDSEEVLTPEKAVPIKRKTVSRRRRWREQSSNYESDDDYVIQPRVSSRRKEQFNEVEPLTERKRKTLAPTKKPRGMKETDPTTDDEVIVKVLDNYKEEKPSRKGTYRGRRKLKRYLGCKARIHKMEDGLDVPPPAKRPTRTKLETEVIVVK